MTADPLSVLPSRHGHFRLESGLHTDCWLTLDALFVDAARIAPLVASLSDRLRRHGPTAVCGPLLGGAFLAQALATALGVRFYYTEPAAATVEAAAAGPDGGLFRARYDLPAAQERRVRDERVAVVDDAVSAGSSVRATVAALDRAGASVVAIGTFLLLGDAAIEHFEGRDIPIEALDRRPLALWPPDECPLCHRGTPLEDPNGS